MTLLHPHFPHFPPHSRRVRVAGIVIALALVVTLLGGLWYLTSDRFQESLRRKLISRLEAGIGGKVEVRSLRWSLRRFEVEVDDLTIHGREAPGQAPFVHVDHALARLKILSLFRQEVGLRYLVLDRPTLHLIAFPDGSTNQPVPGVAQGPARNPVERLFDLAISRVEVHDAALLWNDSRVPLTLNADDLVARVEYSRWHRRFDGNVSAGKLEAGYADYHLPPGSAQADFSLWYAAAELKSFRWLSGRSRLEAKGRITRFSDSEAAFTYTAAFDLAQFSPVLRAPQLRGGLLEVNGRGSYSKQQLSAAGKLAVRNLEWRDAGLHLADLSAGAEYSATRDRLALSQIFATALGGVVTGDGEISGWLPGAQRRGQARLRAEKLRLASVLEAISTPALPLDRIGLAGETSGAIDARWEHSLDNLDAGLALEVRPPAQVASGQLPVSATLRGTYHASAQTLDLSALQLSTPATRVEASGTVGSSSARLDLAVNTADLSEFRSVLAAFRAPARVPVSLHGRAGFGGSLTGKLQALAASGHLEVNDFDSVLPWAALWAGEAPGPAPTTRLHWDSLQADVQLSPSMIAARNGVLQRGATHFAFDGSAELRNYVLEDTSPFTARLALRDSEVGDVLALLGYTWPVSGKLGFELNASGTPRDMQGNGHLQIAAGRIYGEPFQSLRSGIRLAGREAQFSDLVLAHNGAQVSGTAAYNFSNRGLRFDLQGSNFELARFSRLQGPRLSVAGTAGFAAQGSGTLDAPVINAAVHLRGLVLNGEPAGDFDADAVTRGPDLRLEGRSRSTTASLVLAGDIRMRDLWPANLTLDFSRLDFDPLIRAYLPGQVTGHSAMDGKIALQGPLRQPRLLNLTGEIARMSLEVEHVILHSGAPIRFSMANQVFKVEELRIVGEGTDLSATGNIGVAAPHALQAHAQGVMNLKLVETINPGLTAGGTATARVEARGDLAHPRFGGELRIGNGMLSFADWPNGLSEVNGILVFNQNRLQVQSLTARSGGGALDLSGYVSYVRGLYFNLNATSTDIRLRYPPGISSVASADLHFEGTTAGSLFSGEVTVTRFSVDPRFDFALYLARAKQVPVAARASSPLNNLRLDVHFVSVPGLEVQTAQGRLSGDADLRLRGTATHPVVLGRVTLSEGDIFFAGTKYHLDRGELVFTNPVRIEPVVNLEATARVRDYDITLSLHGPTDHLSASYRSDPPLPVGDIIALLALGRTREDTAALSSSNQSAFTESTANAILGQAMQTTVSSRMQKLFGVGRIKIDPQAGGPESNPYARLTIEQQASDKVTLTYITNLSQASQQVVQVEYNINRRISGVAVRDQNGVVGLEVRIRQRKR